jgi:hypothetical protein
MRRRCAEEAVSQEEGNVPSSPRMKAPVNSRSTSTAPKFTL